MNSLVYALDEQIFRLKMVLREVAMLRREVFTKVTELAELAEKTQDPAYRARLLIFAKEHEYAHEFEKRLLKALDRLEDAREELKARHVARALVLLQSALDELSSHAPEIAYTIKRLAREVAGLA